MGVVSVEYIFTTRGSANTIDSSNSTIDYTFL